MFKRAGKNASESSKSKESNLSEVITHATEALSSALAPKTSIPVGQSTSPAKKIDSRSKCYKQLSELNNLGENGILSNEEYMLEKGAVMAVLKQLKEGLQAA